MKSSQSLLCWPTVWWFGFRTHGDGLVWRKVSPHWCCCWISAFSQCRRKKQRRLREKQSASVWTQRIVDCVSQSFFQTFTQYNHYFFSVEGMRTFHSSLQPSQESNDSIIKHRLNTRNSYYGNIVLEHSCWLNNFSKTCCSLHVYGSGVHVNKYLYWYSTSVHNVASVFNSPEVELGLQ